MAILPTYNSKASLSTQPGSTIIDVDQAKTEGRSIAAVGKAVGDVATTWQNAINRTTQTTKDNARNLSIAAIENEALEDINLDNVDTYYKKLDAVKLSSMDGWTDKSAQAQYAPMVNLDITQARIKVDSIYRKKLLNHHDAQRILQSDINREKYFETGDPKWLSEQNKNIAGDYALGFMNEKEKADEELKVKKWSEERLSIDAVREKQVAKQLKENQVKNELGLLERFRQTGLNELRVDDIISMAGNKDIRPKFGEALIEYMNDPKVYDEPAYDNPAFVGYIKAVLEAKNKETINNVLEGALDKKDVAKDQLSIMIGLSVIKSGTLESVVGDAGDKADAKTGLLHAIGAWFSKDRGKEETQGVKEIISNVESGTAPEKALIDAENKAMLKKYPVIGSYPKEGKVIPDKYGNKRKWFPDGSYEDVQ